MKTRQILLVEDHRIMRQAIKLQLELNAPTYEVKEAGNGQQALISLTKTAYDIIITDIDMPQMNGLELVSRIKHDFPTTKILIMSMLTDYKYISEMAELGVNGYISKNCDNSELIEAIETVLSGESYYSREVSANLIKGMKTEKAKSDIINSLSKRELEVLNLVLKEFNNKEIASKLFISSRTVETHKYNLLQKTNAKNIAGLFKFAIQNDLFDDLV